MPKITKGETKNPERNSIFIGVDVGKDGGIVAVDENGKIQFQTVMPTTSGKKPDYDVETIVRILKELSPSHVGIENPAGMLGFSKNAVASLKYCVGLFEGALVGLGIPHSHVNPKVWQSAIWEGHKKITYVDGGKQKTDTKATSQAIANRLAPGHDFRKSQKAEKQHDGIIDAFLISMYIRKSK